MLTFFKDFLVAFIKYVSAEIQNLVSAEGEREMFLK